ncbi:MAG: THUMP-like domain-containing protein [Cyclobacteriaceae bacterium]
MLPSEVLQIIQPNVQEYILENENADEKKLLLSKKEILGIPSTIIANQISGRRKAKLKLPTWQQTKGIVYHSNLAIEQSSSEATAKFKTQIINDLVKGRKSMADLTGGFGVDSLSFSKIFDRVNYVEPNKELVEIVTHNHHQLQAANIQHHNQTAEGFFKKTTSQFDLIFLDPSRRDESNRKVFRLAECLPNISELQPKIFERADHILLKASPLLDIQQGLREITHVRKVFIISVENECKELLFFADQKFSGEPIVEAVNLDQEGKVEETFTFFASNEKKSESQFNKPLSYLYEPNASILKAGAFKLISSRFNIFKLHTNTHLYTSQELIQNFPGRTFKIERIDPTDKELKMLLLGGKANVATRNYPLSAEELKKKLRLKDGGEKFVIGFSGVAKKYIALASIVRPLVS